MIASVNDMVKDPLCGVTGNKYRQHEIPALEVYG